MIPRTEMHALEKTATVADVLALFREDSRERYPVYESSMDNIVGVVSMKQLLNKIASAESAEKTADIAMLPVSDVMLPAYFVPDTMPLSTLLSDFTNNRRLIAIVLDEYGGTEGLITLEDILEEIVGDYEDEFTPRHRHIKKVGAHSFVINGSVRVTELEPKLNYPFPTGDYVTLGGLINHRLGRIPNVGDIVELEGARLEVLEMDMHRITKVLFRDDVSPDAVEDNAFAEARAEGSPTACLRTTSNKSRALEPDSEPEADDLPVQSEIRTRETLIIETDRKTGT
jgi:CBS domain containing-hemolysin-like protein